MEHAPPEAPECGRASPGRSSSCPRPAGPRRRTRSTPSVPRPHGDLPAAVRARPRTGTQPSARAQANALLKDERFAQAAEILGVIVEPAALALGSDNGEVLGLRMERAALRFHGGDYRRALPEFDALRRRLLPHRRWSTS
ncbi:hypothetical protein ACWD5Q_34535 [Streptomyces sp. NPDC002513]